MRAFALCAAVFVGILAVSLPAQQQPLDNKAIVKLHNAGLSDETILHLIGTEPGQYATGVSDIIALKQAGISEKIIRALASRNGPPPASPTPKPGAGPATVPVPASSPAATPQAEASPGTTPQVAPPAASGAQSAGPAAAQPAQSAVYYAKEHQWVPLAVETATWKVGGGKLRAVASAGTIKRDVIGVLGGASSKTTLKAPQFLLYAGQNVAVTQYYFVRLRPHGDAREFPSVKQEDFEFRGTRGTVPFESKEVESHWYRITLPAMEPGEYGIVPPELAASSHTADDSGKMYTFRLIE